MVISICILLVFFSSAIFLLFQGILSKVFELLLKRSKSRVHSARGMRSPHPDIGFARISVYQVAFWSSNLFPPSTSMRNLLQHNVVTQISSLPHTAADSTNESPSPIFISCQRDGCILVKFRPSCLVVVRFSRWDAYYRMALSSIVHFSTSHVLRTFDGQSHPGTHGTRIPPRRSFAKK